MVGRREMLLVAAITTRRGEYSRALVVAGRLVSFNRLRHWFSFTSQNLDIHDWLKSFETGSSVCSDCVFLLSINVWNTLSTYTKVPMHSPAQALNGAGQILPVLM